MRWNSWFQRVVSCVLAATMLLGIFPTSVHAADTEHKQPTRISKELEYQRTYIGRTAAEMAVAYRVVRDAVGRVQYISFEEKDVPSISELAHLFDINGSFDDTERADAHMYQVLIENYGITKEQADQGIERHGERNRFLNNLRQFRITKEHYHISEELEKELVGLILSGFSNSEAVAAAISSRAFDIPLDKLAQAKQASFANENQKETEEGLPLAGNGELTIDNATGQMVERLGLGAAGAEMLPEISAVGDKEAEERYDAAKQVLFTQQSEKGDANVTTYDVATIANSVASSYAPEEHIGQQYTYLDHGDVSVTANTGDYTYTETDLMIEGVNGLDLKLERQFTSVLASTGLPYGYFYSGYEDVDVYEVGYEVYEWTNYEETIAEDGQLIQPSYSGPYAVSDYTYDFEIEDHWCAYTAEMYNDAIAYLSSLSYIFAEAYDSSGNSVYVILKPILCGIEPDFDEVCQNRVRSHSYTLNAYNLGTGWRFNFPSIEKYRAKQFSGEYSFDGDDSLYKRRLILEDGSRYEIDLSAEESSHLVGYPFEDMVVQKENGQYRLEYLDGRTVHFNSDGLMSSMEDAFGNEITVSYSGDTNFTITDTVGNTIAYTNVAVAADTYFNGETDDAWRYNVKNNLTLNGETIRTYYSYFDTATGVQYLKFITDEAGQATLYTSLMGELRFNTFSAASSTSSNDETIEYVRLRKISYPDGMQVQLNHTSRERRIGETGRMSYYALRTIRHYDSVLDEYHQDSKYTYGDFDGLYAPQMGYKTVKQEYYAGNVEEDFYEIEKLAEVQAFFGNHNRECEMVLAFNELQFDEGIETFADVESLIAANQCYLQSEVRYEYDDDDVPLPTLVENLLYDKSRGGGGTEETYRYNEYGQVIEHVKANGESVLYTYDNSFGLLKTITYQQNADIEIVVTNTLTDNDRKIGTTTITANGAVQSKIEYDYDAYGNLIDLKEYTTDTTYHQTQYTYANNAWLMEEKTLGVADSQGISVNGSPGYTVGVIAQKTTYNNRGWPVTSIDGDGNVTRYTYNTLGQVTKIVYPDETQQNIAYDTANRTMTVTDALGTVTRSIYDGSGNLREVRDVESNAVLETNTYTYGRLVKETVHGSTCPDQTKYFYYDALDRVIETGYLNTAGSKIYSEYTKYYDGSYKVVKIIEGDGNAPDREETSYYDEMGNVIETEIVYDTENNESAYNQYTYDYVGNCVRAVCEYSEEGAVSTETEYTYDAAGNVRTQTDALNNTVTNTYDLAGNLVSVKDPKGSETIYTYDALDRLVKVQQPFAQSGAGVYTAVTQYVYDNNGNLISEVIRNEVPGQIESERETEYEYDNRNRLITAVMYGPNANYTQYRYDAAGNLLKVYTGLTSKLSFTAAGIPSGSDTSYAVTAYEYDERSNLVKMTDALGQSETYGYDRNGTVIRKVDRNGNTTNYTYSNMGQVLTVEVSDCDGVVTDTLSYTYTTNGLVWKERNDEHLTEYAYDVFGRVIEVETDDSKVYSTYDLMGNRTWRAVYQDMNLIAQTSYAYDSNGRMTSVTDAGVTADYTYDKNGNPTSVTYSNGNSVTYTYNLANYPVTLINEQGDTVLSSYEYIYTLDGNIVLESNSSRGEYTAYTYDGMNRLISEEKAKNGVIVQTYAYEFDNFSNRSKLTAAGEETYTTTYTYDINNRLLEDIKVADGMETKTLYFYDPNGNQISKTSEILAASPNAETTRMTDEFESFEICCYNGFNQLTGTKVNGVTAEYSYAPTGLRLSKTIDSARTDYVLDDVDVVAELHEGDLTAYYARGINLFSSFIGEDQYFYLHNAHGDVVLLADDEGYVNWVYEYDAFGNEKDLDASDNNPFRYCGEYYDGETGSYYLRARYYDPVVGRMLAEDPYWNNYNRIHDSEGFVSNTAIMQSGNLYVYCCSNAVLYVDPTGELLQAVRDAVVHNAVLDHIAYENPITENRSLTRHNTYVLRNGVDRTDGWGFVDLYDSMTGEVWELKKNSTSRKCSTEYAQAQLNAYVQGIIKKIPNTELRVGGYLAIGTSTAPTVIKKKIWGYDYVISYWEEGNGILRYDYSYSKTEELQLIENIIITIGSIQPPVTSGIYSPQPILQPVY